MSELQGKLMESQNEAAATKEELNSCRESLEKLQELLQVQTHSDIQDLITLVVLCAFAVLYNSSGLFGKFLHIYILYNCTF